MVGGSTAELHNLNPIYVAFCTYFARWLVRTLINRYRLSAAQNNINAVYSLGLAYYKGHGVAKSYAKALEYFMICVDYGEASAMNTIGNMYKSGQGVEINDEIAIEWYKQSVALG